MSRDLVSVVTPFHNSAEYLPKCIESVLAQTHSEFEYILSDNCSTDGSLEIAQHYAALDPRIRLIRQPALVPQVPHYNRAIGEISGSSQYCKIVQADDCVFGDCLRLMVAAFEQSDSIGLVSSYYLKGDTLRGSGFPHGTHFLSGEEMARFYLRTGVYVFGSPTTVMYRASIVRDCVPFYQEGLLHEDTEKCLQILQRWNFGFVHQVLSFLRVGNESVSSAVHSYQPESLDWYIIVQRYASAFLDSAEAADRRKESKRDYYRALAREGLRFPAADFWKYHREGLKTLNEVIDRRYLALQMVGEFLWMVANPGVTARQLKHAANRRMGRPKIPETSDQQLQKSQSTTTASVNPPNR